MPSPRRRPSQNRKAGVDPSGGDLCKGGYSVPSKGKIRSNSLNCSIINRICINRRRKRLTAANEPGPGANAGRRAGGGHGMDRFRRRSPTPAAAGGMPGFAGMGGGMGGMMMSGQNPPNVQSVQFPGFNQTGRRTGGIRQHQPSHGRVHGDDRRTRAYEKNDQRNPRYGEGTIIELDKLAGEPVDILVNHKLIATGEVVVIDENFGVRVTEIVSPAERMKDLT